MNPRYCYGCQPNSNTIDLLLAPDYDFRSAGTWLEQMLNQYLSQRSKRTTTDRE